MKRITLIIGHLWQGGAERVCVNLANEFVKLNYEVEVVVFSLEKAIFNKELDEKVKLTCLNIESNKKAVWQLFKYMKKSFPSHIIAFNYHISFFLVLLKVFFKFKLLSRSISTLSENFKTRNTLVDKVIIKMLVFALKKSDIVIAQSSGMRDDLLQLKIKSNKIATINNPINPKYIGIKSEKKEDYILFVGRLSKEKAIDHIINIMPTIPKKYKLIIIGGGPEEEQLKLLVENIRIEDRIQFLGYKSNVEYYLQKAQCTVLSSLYEGFPNVLVESIACGTPVVSFDCPNGPSEIIVDGLNGYLVNYLDSDDLSEKINMTLKHDFDSIKMKKSVERFYPEKIAKKYIEVIFAK